MSTLVFSAKDLAAMAFLVDASAKDLAVISKGNAREHEREYGSRRGKIAPVLEVDIVREKAALRVADFPSAKVNDLFDLINLLRYNTHDGDGLDAELEPAISRVEAGAFKVLYVIARESYAWWRAEALRAELDRDLAERDAAMSEW